MGLNIKLLFIFLITIFNPISAQLKPKDYSRILHSTNIYEIDAFLRDAHPDDPKRMVLKPRLIKMLKEYIRNAHPSDQRVKDFQEKLAFLGKRKSTRISFQEMDEIIRQKQIAKYQEQLRSKITEKTNVTKTTDNIANSNSSNVNATAGLQKMNADEQAEFDMLMSVNPLEHKNNTVKILNSLFDNDPNSKESIVMIENKSECNMIMRIEGVGNTRYRLAVPAKSNNTIVVTKGDYLFSSLVCGAQYASQKTIQKAIMVSLGDMRTK